VSAGECRPELPEGGLRAATASHKDDLQAVNSSLPVENGNGIHVDTLQIKAAQVKLNEKKGRIEDSGEIGQNGTKGENESIQRKTQVLGYVAIEILNMSLEAVQLVKQTHVGVASPITVKETRKLEGYDVNTVQQESAVNKETLTSICGRKWRI
jgi:transcription antitermination factor NusG